MSLESTSQCNRCPRKNGNLLLGATTLWHSEQKFFEFLGFEANFLCTGMGVGRGWVAL